jgi:hypothetical protein
MGKLFICVVTITLQYEHESLIQGYYGSTVDPH